MKTTRSSNRIDALFAFHLCHFLKYFLNFCVYFVFFQIFLRVLVCLYIGIAGKLHFSICRSHRINRFVILCHLPPPSKTDLRVEHIIMSISWHMGEGITWGNKNDNSPIRTITSNVCDRSSSGRFRFCLLLCANRLFCTWVGVEVFVWKIEIICVWTQAADLEQCAEMQRVQARSDQGDVDRKQISGGWNNKNNQVINTRTHANKTKDTHKQRIAIMVGNARSAQRSTWLIRSIPIETAAQCPANITVGNKKNSQKDKRALGQTEISK